MTVEPHPNERAPMPEEAMVLDATTTADGNGSEGPSHRVLVASPSSRLALRRFVRYAPGVIGLAILVVVALVSIGADLIAPYDPRAVSPQLLQPPGGGHLLGTDTVGRDIFSQLIYGGRVSLIVAVVTGVGTLVIGALVGAIAGYYGGRVDAVLMRVAEVFQVIPSFALALIIVAVLGTNLAYICGALVMALWPQMARLVRGEVLRIMTTDMVAAAKTVGHSNRSIIVSDVLPNAMPSLIVQVTIDLGSAILLQAGLSFLGLGDPSNLSWGDILQQAQSDLSAWWMSVPAGAVIFVVVLSANFVGDGLNHAFPAEGQQLMSAGLSIRDFSVVLRTPHGAIQPVDNVSLDVQPGQRVALVGESGCGKSMLLRGLLRFIPPSMLGGLSGQASYDDVNLAEVDDRKLRAYRGRRIAIVFQDAMARLNPTMTVGEQVAEVIATGDRHARDEHVSQLFRSVGLDGSPTFLRRYPHELSGGMRQRVLIAIALAGDPELLIADEPTTALDVTVQSQILDTITEVVRERGMALLMVTHDLGVVSETCEYVYVMYAGQVVESGPVRQVFSAPAHPYTRGLLDCVLDIGDPVETAVKTIPGVVPAPGSIPKGCRFRSRCPSAHARCEADPPVVQTGHHTSARCWLHVDADLGARS